MQKDEKFSMRLPAHLKAELQRRAEAESRSLAAYIVLALQRHVDQTPAPPADAHLRAALRAAKTSKFRKS